MQYFRKNQVDTDQGMIQKVKGMSVDEALRTIRTKILQRFRGNEASTRAAFRVFDKDGGGEVTVRLCARVPSRVNSYLICWYVCIRQVTEFQQVMKVRPHCTIPVDGT